MPLDLRYLPEKSCQKLMMIGGKVHRNPLFQNRGQLLHLATDHGRFNKLIIPQKMKPNRLAHRRKMMQNLLSHE